MHGDDIVAEEGLLRRRRSDREFDVVEAARAASCGAALGAVALRAAPDVAEVPDAAVKIFSAPGEG